MCGEGCCVAPVAAEVDAPYSLMANFYFQAFGGRARVNRVIDC